MADIKFKRPIIQNDVLGATGGGIYWYNGRKPRKLFGRSKNGPVKVIKPAEGK